METLKYAALWVAYAVRARFTLLFQRRRTRCAVKLALELDCRN